MDFGREDLGDGVVDNLALIARYLSSRWKRRSRNDKFERCPAEKKTPGEAKE